MTAAPLPAEAWAKFVKVAGLLASDHDGERATAARMATDLLRKHGLTWGEVLAPSCPYCVARREASRRPPEPSWPREPERPPHRPEPSRAGTARPRARTRQEKPRQPHWRDTAMECLRHVDRLATWEVAFVRALLRRDQPSNPTPKERRVLDDIVAKIRRSAEP